MTLEDSASRIRPHDAIRRLHYRRRTEETYIQWARRFIYFNDKRHPEDAAFS
jgi:hypothetical protein